jgi:ATP-dependent HslUV protease subunit HslV
MIVSDGADVLVLSGAGDVIEPDPVRGDPGADGAAAPTDDGVAAIGSGGHYARAAALALLRHTELDAEVVAREAMAIAAQICIYSNHHLTIETLEAP